MGPILKFNQSISISPEKYVNACDLAQLYELCLLADKRIKAFEEFGEYSEMDIANLKHEIILKQNKTLGNEQNFNKSRT